LVGDGAVGGATGLGVVGPGFAGGFAGLEVLDVFPAEGDVGFGARSAVDAVVDAVVEVGVAGGAGQADVGEAAAGGEDDAAVLVVPGFGFVLAHNGKLDAVEGE